MLVLCCTFRPKFGGEIRYKVAYNRLTVSSGLEIF